MDLVLGEQTFKWTNRNLSDFVKIL